MSLFELIMKAAGATGDLRALLIALRDLAPDLRAEIEAWIVQLDQTVTLEGLASVVTALPAEMANALRGKLDPKDHPSDAI